jgi:hypothetical protein
MFLHFLIGSVSLVVMIGARRRGGVKNWYKRIVLSAEWIQHLRLLLYSHVHDASRPAQSAGMLYLWMSAKSWAFFPNKVCNFVHFLDRNQAESLCLFFFLVGWRNHAFFSTSLVPVLFRSAEF